MRRSCQSTLPRLRQRRGLPAHQEQRRALAAKRAERIVAGKLAALCSPRQPVECGIRVDGCTGSCESAHQQGDSRWGRRGRGGCNAECNLHIVFRRGSRRPLSLFHAANARYARLVQAGDQLCSSRTPYCLIRAREGGWDRIPFYSLLWM